MPVGGGLVFRAALAFLRPEKLVSNQRGYAQQTTARVVEHDNLAERKPKAILEIRQSHAPVVLGEKQRRFEAFLTSEATARALASHEGLAARERGISAVSYTHLTLPTILLV